MDVTPMNEEREMDMPEIRKGIDALDREYPDSTMVIYKPTDEQRRFMDRVLLHYAGATQKRRDEIREAFRGKYGPLNMLEGYALVAAGKLKSTRDENWLKAGLTAAAIEDSLGRVDERDRLLVLAELYVTAEEAGIDPQPAFENLYGIADFSGYAVVRSRRNGPA